VGAKIVANVAMDRAAAEAFVGEWCDSWNAHDLDALMAHYHGDVTFISPKAAVIVGDPVIRGKDALRAYWGAAIERTTDRRFTPERHVWDPETNEIVLVYLSEVDGRRVRATEFFWLDASGLVIAGEAMYGAEM
jgi:ketosteroid isomerase-like protein